MKKRFLFACLSVLLLVMLLITGCTKENSGEESTSDDPISDEISDYLNIINSDGSSEFKIVHALFGDKELTSTVNLLQRRMNNNFSSNIEMVSHTANGESGTVENDTFEILIGQTNRKQSKEALKDLSKGEYIILASGNKLVITGTTNEAIVEAVNVFMEKYVANADKASGIIIPREEMIKGTKDMSTIYKDADLRIMTLNVCLSNHESEKRRTHILNLIEDYNPTVICFQEYNAASYTRIGAALSGEYNAAISSHPDGSGIAIYTPIYYRTDTFTLVDSDGGWLRDRFTGTNTKCYSWAVLKFKDSGKIFAVTNYHGAVASKDYEGYENYSDEQITQLAVKWTYGNVQQLLEILAAIKAEHGNIPFLCAGDFNFDKTMSAYKLATDSGMVEAETHATVSRCDGYRGTHTPGTPARYGNTIDHIFYDPNYVTAYVHYTGATTEDELAASDHLMVYADIGFNS